MKPRPTERFSLGCSARQPQADGLFLWVLAGAACDYSAMPFQPVPRRAICKHCLRPQATCLCALAQPTAHRTEVLVLQHPQEQRHAKNSVALLRLSLANCEVVVGERFEPAVLQALLHRPGRDTRLLYPDVPAAPSPLTPETTTGMPLRLVVIDATWRKSLRMLLEHPALAGLPRLSLDAPAPTHYRAIRAARRAGVGNGGEDGLQWSTVAGSFWQICGRGGGAAGGGRGKAQVNAPVVLDGLQQALLLPGRQDGNARQAPSPAPRSRPPAQETLQELPRGSSPPSLRETPRSRKGFSGRYQPSFAAFVLGDAGGHLRFP